MKRWLILVPLLLIGCGDKDGPGSFGQPGDPCGPNLGCADGLTCHEGHCVKPGVGGDGADAAAPLGDDMGASSEDMSRVGSMPDLARGNGGNGGSGGSGGGGGGGGGDGGVGMGGCGPCDSPPDLCHATTGTCENGRCVYAFVNGAPCDDGDPCTVADTCTSNGCYGTPKVCDQPPATVCISAAQQQSYDKQGTCSGGRCVYQSHVLACPSGECVDNSCASDPCASMSCNMPPSVCFGAAGVCSGGSCSYPFADGTTCNDGNPCTDLDQCSSGVCKGVPHLCNNPPANSCVDGSTLKAFAATGSCSAGACSYSPQLIACSAGCSNNACNPSGWTLANSDTDSNLHAVWGSSASAVWAVGENGTLDFYDGVRWGVRPAPPALFGSPVTAVHGSGPNDVYAIAYINDGVSGSPHELIHFDGSQWSLTGANLGNSCLFTGLYATGNASGDVYVSCYSGNSGTSLMRVNGTTVTTIATDTTTGCNFDDGRGTAVYPFAANNIIVAGCNTWQWDGAKVNVIGGTQVPANSLYVAGPKAIFAAYADSGWGGLRSPMLWNGSAWTMLSLGLSGSMGGISGTSATRVFVAGWDSKPLIYTYDGFSMTRVAMPDGTSQLNAIWAAPTGEVFAVGQSGTIVKGP
jgi:hypothetical protein